MKLHHSRPGKWPSLIVIMLPLWTALLIILYDLTRRMYRIQNGIYENNVKMTTRGVDSNANVQQLALATTLVH